jgi:hypothetical protein
MSIIIMVMPQHQKVIRYGELMCSLSPTGSDPVEKAITVNSNTAEK